MIWSLTKYCGGRGQGNLCWTLITTLKKIKLSHFTWVADLTTSSELLFVVSSSFNLEWHNFTFSLKKKITLRPKKKIIISSSDSEAFKLLKRINISKNLYIKFYKINDTTYNNFKIHIFLVCICGTVHFGRIWLEEKENLFKLHVSTNKH